jgi:hypothetical protein
MERVRGKSSCRNSRLNRVVLQNATMAIGRSRRPRGPTYARGTNRSLFEDQELADNARRFATRRAHPAFKFFCVAHSGSGSFICRVICASHHGGAGGGLTPLGWRAATYLSEPHFHFLFLFTFSCSLLSDR